MNNVHELRQRLLQEWLRNAYRKGLTPDEKTEIILRLAGLTLTLVERHAMDAKGRCLVPGCSLQRRMPWRKWRTCQIFVTALFWIEQPIEIVQQAELR